MSLPSAEELTPLTQSLIPPQLAMAFGIIHENFRTLTDLKGVLTETGSTKYPKEDDLNVLNVRVSSERNETESGKMKMASSVALDEENSGSKDENRPNRAVKRPRIAWTPELHQRFMDVIGHLGIDKAVPKTIMKMMNVEGLTRANVASHLQKYRTYVKRMEGLGNEGYSTTRGGPGLFGYDRFGSISTPMSTQALPHGSSSQMSMAGQSIGPYGGGFGHSGSAGAGGNCGLESEGFAMFWNRHTS